MSAYDKRLKPLKQLGKPKLNNRVHLESQLDDSPYFGSNHLTLADITAGTLVTQLPSVGVPLDDYPKLSSWCDRLMQRDSWKATEPSPESIEASIPQAKALMRAYLT